MRRRKRKKLNGRRRRWGMSKSKNGVKAKENGRRKEDKSIE